MQRILFHIYGPFAIQSFGLALCVAIIVAYLLFLRDPRTKLILANHSLESLIVSTIIFGIIGGRLLTVALDLSHYTWSTWHTIWDGGFSLIGAIMGISIGLPIYLRIKKIAMLPFFDLITTYAPLVQSIARLGCFGAGCCHGVACSFSYAITYSDPLSFAPLGVPLHPTQLYSALLLFALFIFLYRQKSRPFAAGTTYAFYCIGMGAERFLVDFWRGDRIIDPSLGTALSIHQYLALGFCLIGVGILVHHYYAFLQSRSTAL